jgi:hypothetical protein
MSYPFNFGYVEGSIPYGTLPTATPTYPTATPTNVVSTPTVTIGFISN